MKTISAHTLYMREWRKRHPDHAAYQREYHKNYYALETHRAEALKRAAEWQALNPERAAARKRRWCLENKERRMSTQAAWNARNIDRLRKYKRMETARRRALVSESSVTVDQVIAKSGMICGICLKPIVGEFHIDHIKSVSQGGTHLLSNLQMAHPVCNKRKGAGNGQHLLDYK